MYLGATSTNRSHLELLAQLLLFLFIFSLAIMQPPIRLLGFAAVPSDFLFVGLAAVCALLVALRRISMVIDRAYYFIGAYLLTMIISLADEPTAAAYKLLTQFYLFSLPIFVCSLVRDESTLRTATLWWIGGTTVVVGVAVVSLTLFALDPEHPVLDYTRSHFGTLPPGNYPRLRLTFLNANMACNYLSVSLMLLLAARHLKWVRPIPFVLVLAGLLIAAAATISPGLGGIALAIGLWLWLVLRERRPAIARLAIAGAIFAALLMIAATAITPILHPTSPFLIELPFINVALAPAGRLIIWIDAFDNFLNDPLFGRGIGTDPVTVSYLDPSGNIQRLTDAHNIFLSIAVQCGAVGLAALVAMIAHAVRRTLPLRLPGSSSGVVRLSIGLAVLNGLVYQGLGGSFEDARHLRVAASDLH